MDTGYTPETPGRHVGSQKAEAGANNNQPPTRMSTAQCCVATGTLCVPPNGAAPQGTPISQLTSETTLNNLTPAKTQERILLLAPQQSAETAQENLGQQKACLRLLLEHKQGGQRPAGTFQAGGVPSL